jgi:predicted nucleotidyltransferase
MTARALELVTSHQRLVAERFLSECARERRHVVVYLSGAHAYGFPSPDSDLDLKAVHVDPTAERVGLRRPRDVHDVLVTVDGVELDYTSNELGAVLSGLLSGNANYFERLLGPTTVLEDALLEELRPLAERALSRRVHGAYRGFATAQHRALVERPTVKRLLYVLRTTLTGAHLLATGDVVPDLVALYERWGFGCVPDLVARKLAGEREPLATAELASFESEVARAFDVLDRELERSVLPTEPPNGAELEAWLVGVRRRLF